MVLSLSLSLNACRMSGDINEVETEASGTPVVETGNQEPPPPPVAIDWVVTETQPSPSPSDSPTLAATGASSSVATAESSSSAAAASSSSAAAASSSSASQIVTPTVTGLNPSAGPLAGGATLTLSGTGFSAPSAASLQVSVAGIPCTSPIIVSDSVITCTAGAANVLGTGTAVVTRTDQCGTTGSLLSAYTYQPNFQITSVTPTNGRLAGGTTLTLTGVRFASGMSVTVDGSACTSTTAVNATTATCLSPASASAGSKLVSGLHPDGQTAAVTGSFTYNALPVLTSVSPSFGVVGGGASLTLTGANFLTGAYVTVDGTLCTAPTLVSSSSITCTLPAGSIGAKNVVVTNPDTQGVTLAGGFTYGVLPTLSSVTPDNGRLAGSQNVTITGTGFSATTTAAIDGASCTIGSFTDTSIICQTPSKTAGSKNLVLANGANFSATFSAAYTYNPFPTVSSLSPTEVGTGGGVVVTITGTGFLTAVTSTVGGTACTSLTRNSATSLSCTVPAKAVASYDVVVTNPDSQAVTQSSAIAYVSGPTFASVTPNNGKLSGNISVTIAGSNFSTGTAPTVTVGGTACSVGSNTATQIVCTAPAKTAGAYDVVITNSNSTTTTAASAFTYNPFPTISSVSPSSGTTVGGTSITVAGTGFLLTSGFKIEIDGSTCTVPAGNATAVSCTTPSGTAGAKTITVTNADTQSVNSTFTYLQAPTLSGVQPPAGAVAGGFTLTLSGSNFTTDQAPTVNIAGTDCPVVNNNATTVTCTAPAKSAATY
ncbi:MAG: IPT/TIG domain-containing protein, partial [Bdellovibrionota bacterium]